MTGESIFEAIKKGETERVKQLLAADPSLAGARNDIGLSAILWAQYHRRADIVRAVLAADPPLDICEAAAVGKIARVKELLQADPALVNARSTDGNQPLGLACFFAHPQIVDLLLSQGADVHAAADNAMKVQPLHAAAAANDIGICRALLERGADPNARQQMGWTPLHQAVHKKNAELVQLMLRHQGDPRQTNDEGNSAIDIAVAEGATAIREMLEAAV